MMILLLILSQTLIISFILKKKNLLEKENTLFISL